MHVFHLFVQRLNIFTGFLLWTTTKQKNFGPSELQWNDWIHNKLLCFYPRHGRFTMLWSGLILLQHGCYRVHSSWKHAASTLSLCSVFKELRSAAPVVSLLCPSCLSQDRPCGRDGRRTQRPRPPHMVCLWTKVGQSQAGRTRDLSSKPVFVVCVSSVEGGMCVCKHCCRFFLCFTCDGWTKLHVKKQR